MFHSLILQVFLMAACSPYDREINLTLPETTEISDAESDLLKSEVEALTKGLPEEDAERVKKYVLRQTLGKLLGTGEGIPEGTTVQEAIFDQRAFDEEQARIASLHAEYDLRIETAGQLKAEVEILVREFDLEAAGVKLSEAEALVAGIPDDYPGKVLLGIEGNRRVYEALLKDWIAGRWGGTFETDKMTGQPEAVVLLRATNGMPNSIGRLENVHLILRCQKGKLDAYVSTGSILEADWRYDTVVAKHRYEDTEPVRITGTRSSGNDAMFLRNPAGWMKDFKANDGKVWLIEIPPYGRMPYTIEFNLTGSTKAINKLEAFCK